jgi:hypothetical protein
VRRAIPGLVLIGIIENDDLALAPPVHFVFDPDAEHVAWLRNNQTEMKPQHSVVRTTVGAP